MNNLKSRRKIKISAEGLINFFTIILLFLVIFQLPTIEVSNNHDLGSVAAYDYWTLRGFFYGKDIIQNVGPFGFIGYPSIYTGFLDKPKLIINFILVGFLVFSLWDSSKGQSILIRTTFLILAGLFVVGDPMFYILLLLLSYRLANSKSLKNILLLTIFLAFIALAKGTLFFISLFIIASYVIGCLILRRFVFALSAIGFFAVSILLFWVFAGQPLTNFPSFVYTMASFSNGYNQAMATFESQWMQLLGITTLLLSTLLIFWHLINAIKKNRDLVQLNQSLSLVLIELFILFIVWKHGFVRADEHVAIFFQYALVSSILKLFLQNPFFSSTFVIPAYNFTRVSKALVVIIIIFSFIGISVAFKRSPDEILRLKYQSVQNNLLGITNPDKFFEKLDSKLRVHIKKMQLPRANEIVGSQSVAYFGMLPGIMLYNKFNYVSIPSTISFASWSEKIMKADAMFFRNDSRAPDYLIFDLKTVDNRLPAQDDSLAQLEILHRYRVVDYENGNAILEHIKNRAPLSNKSISTGQYQAGDFIYVPNAKYSSIPIWVKIKIDENFFSKLISLFYKPPQYFVEILFNNDTKESYKFIPQMASTGFLINPLIIDNKDNFFIRSEKASSYSKTNFNSIKKVIGFRIGCEKLINICGRRVSVIFEEVEGLDLGKDLNRKEFNKIYGQLYDFNVELLDVKVDIPIKNKEAFGKVFYQFPAPSIIKILKHKDFKKIKGYYAVEPLPNNRKLTSSSLESIILRIKKLVGRFSEIHNQNEPRNAVNLSIRFAKSNSTSILIFKRKINPKEIPEDRMEQILDVNLPDGEGILSIEVSPTKGSENDFLLIRNLNMQKLND